MLQGRRLLEHIVDRRMLGPHHHRLKVDVAGGDRHRADKRARGEAVPGEVEVALSADAAEGDDAALPCLIK